jgi:hypothetical protein
MRDRRLARWLLCLALSAGTTPGCQVLHAYRPVVVEVRDAETGKPIPGAEVRLTYPLTRPSAAPCISSGTTADDGIAHLRAAPEGEGGLRVEAHAGRYMPEVLSVPVEAIEEIEPAPLIGADHPRSVNFVLPMWARPSPTVELVVPDGFRGLIRAEVQVHDEAPCPPGQRHFSYQVDSSGYALVSGPGLLRRVYTPDFHARFADGTPLARQGGVLDVVFRPLKADVDIQYFVVGNQKDFDEVRRVADKLERKLARPPESGKGAKDPNKRHKASDKIDAAPW